jgi:tetratricopeptide (TPR) repeat protein
MARGMDAIVRTPRRRAGGTIAAVAVLASLATPGCATLRGRKDNIEAVARRQLAEVLWKTGDLEAAVAHSQAAVELDPRHAPTIVRCGELLLATGSVDGARQRAEDALVLDSTLAGAWALRGRVHRHQGEFEQALADFHQSLRYNQHASDVLLDAAELQFQLGRPQRCLTTLQSLLETYAPGEEPRRAMWLEGLAFSATGRPADAVAALSAASTRGPAEPELLFQLAHAQAAAGQPAAAAVTARQAADAGHVGSQALLAELQAGDAAGGTILR